MELRLLAAGSILGGILSLASLCPVDAAELAAHRALYNLTLGSARSDEVVAATGKMAYEVLDACDGWAVRQRLQMTITNRDGQDIEMVSDYTTFETKDGLKLRYRMRQTTETAVTSEVEGEAAVDKPGGTGEAHFSKPEDARKALPPGVLFPMAHTGAIIAGAEAGKKFLALPLFDGTSAEGAQDSTVTILNWNPPASTQWPELSKLPSGRVHVAFFDRTAGASQPDYEVGMRYWENGVADDLEMDFGDFMMKGKMVQFEPQKPNC